MLPRHQSQPGGALAAVLEIFSVAHSGHKSCRSEWPDSLYRRHALAGFAGSMQGFDLLIEGRDLFLQRQQFVVERSKKSPAECGQLVVRVLQNERQTTPQLADVLG